MFRNQTQVTEFILLGFGDIHNLHMLLFLIFLIIYIVTMTANILIVGLVVFEQYLHTPMYYFLGNLSFLEVCYTSNLLPKMLSDLWTGDRIISFSGCITQWYFCASFIVTEFFLLCAMSYDRYVAICKPLHYATVMNTKTFIQLAVASWIHGFALCMSFVILIFQLTFCGPSEIDHYFCDYFPLLKLSCSDTRLSKMMMYLVAAIVTIFPLLLTLTSYVYIIAAVLNIPSTTGRKKGFSTCSSHLVVVSIFYVSLIIVYVLPSPAGMHGMEKILSLLYTALPPLVNPFIYSLRNKEFKYALRNNIHRILLSKTNLIKVIN